MSQRHARAMTSGGYDIGPYRLDQRRCGNIHEARLLPRMAQRRLDFPETVSPETGSGWQESSDVRIELRRPSLA
jgi:hypothetical protein